ncbi:hypothetical protein UFOVP190_70 [uncultured Caudovirales phage]|uniref:Uncharacterized protein n=1 Tax=uncultured Caudovirales phage TaxID=2100421 RepID=A0A6J7WGU0_9CAUD|nr:hypothetical protein UFOVP190_70 [uncultured Caudovirales phage]
MELLEQYDKESRALKEEALKMSWFMRGGVSYDDAMALSRQEREIVANIIKKNMETTKDSGLPFF